MIVGAPFGLLAGCQPPLTWALDYGKGVFECPKGHYKVGQCCADPLTITGQMLCAIYGGAHCNTPVDPKRPPSDTDTTGLPSVDTGLPAWVPWAIGGAVVLVGAAMVLRPRRRAA